MQKVKTIIVAFFISLICLNSDCNKIEETPPINDFFLLEGRLVNSCTDNTPMRYKSFICYEENNLNQIDVLTDSNGYFKIYSKFRSNSIILKEDGGKTILYKIPGMKNINFGNISYNFTMGLRLTYKSYKSLSATDSLLIDVSGVNPTNPYKSSYVKGPLSNEDLGVIYIKESPMYINKDSIRGDIYLVKDYRLNQFQKKRYLVKESCNNIEEIVFD